MCKIWKLATTLFNQMQKLDINSFNTRPNEVEADEGPANFDYRIALYCVTHSQTGLEIYFALLV